MTYTEERGVVEEAVHSPAEDEQTDVGSAWGGVGAAVTRVNRQNNGHSLFMVWLCRVLVV